MADWEAIIEKGIKIITKLFTEKQNEMVNWLARTDKETFKKIYDNRKNRDEGSRTLIEMAAERRKWKG